MIVRVRNLSDHAVSIDRVRLEYTRGRILREVALSGARVPGLSYVPIPGTIPAHAAGATYLTAKERRVGSGGPLVPEGLTRVVVTEASEQREFRSGYRGEGRADVSVWLDEIGDVKGKAPGIDIVQGSAEVQGSRLIGKISLRDDAADDTLYSMLLFRSKGAGVRLSADRTADGRVRFLLNSGRGRVVPASGSIRRRVVTLRAPLARLPLIGKHLRAFAFESQTWDSIHSQGIGAGKDCLDYDRVPELQGEGGASPFITILEVRPRGRPITAGCRVEQLKLK